MPDKIGFRDSDINKALRVLDKLGLDPKDVNRAASKALIPAVKKVKQSIASFKGNNEDGISKAMLLSRMVKRRMNRSGYLPGARIVIDGPEIPMGDREWTAQGVAKLFQKEYTGPRKTRKSGANRGEFSGKSVGGGDNYVWRFANEVKSTTNRLFDQEAAKLMRKNIKKATNG